MTLPFPFLIPKELGEVRWTATVRCPTVAAFQSALDRYNVPDEDRFCGLLPRDEVSVTFANVTLVLTLAH